jgi:hypothetical protein
MHREDRFDEGNTTMVMLRTNTFTMLLALAATAVPVGALAQTSAPSYSNPAAQSAEDTVHGRIESYDGGSNLQLRDDRGFVDNVLLTPSTTVGPAGSRLQVGVSVTIVGLNRGPVLAADRIDVVAQTYSGAPALSYADPYPYPYPVPVPYPVYPYPYPVYGYPYGPAFSIGIGIGPFYGRGFRDGGFHDGGFHGGFNGGGFHGHR